MDKKQTPFDGSTQALPAPLLSLTLGPAPSDSILSAQGGLAFVKIDG